MKKTLAALAVLGAFAGSALAADVTLYGVADVGLNYKHVSKTDKASTDSFSMASGQNAGSRFGLKGTEDLGNGVKVGFNLENGFSVDDGTLGQGSRLFGREALVFVQTGYGELGLGRTGSIDAGTGRYAVMGTAATPMGLGYVDNIGKGKNILKGMGDRYDNTITYKSPKMAGLTILAQASLKRDSKENEKLDKEGVKADADNDIEGKDPTLSAGAEGSSDAVRYYALGATYNVGDLNAGLVYSMTDWGRQVVNAREGSDDKLQVVSGFVNYNFGMVKPMIAAQYWDGGLQPDSTKDAAVVHKGWYEKAGQSYDTKGYGLVIGATAPVAGGLVRVEAGWNDYESTNAADKADYNDMIVAAHYEYPLSKRTSVYTGVGFEQNKSEIAGKTTKTNSTQAMFGMTHKF